jgi:hypothetical protein
MASVLCADADGNNKSVAVCCCAATHDKSSQFILYYHQNLKRCPECCSCSDRKGWEEEDHVSGLAGMADRSFHTNLAQCPLNILTHTRRHPVTVQ